MQNAFTSLFEFQKLPIRFGGQILDFFGEADVIANRRTFRILPLWAEATMDGVRIQLPRIPPGSLFEQFRVRLHVQCGADIAERLDHAIRHQGGYEILFGEALPTNAFERGRDPLSLGGPELLWNLAA